MMTSTDAACREHEALRVDVSTVRCGARGHTFDELPLEVIALIADQVHDFGDLCRMVLVCQQFRGAVSLCSRWRVVEEIISTIKDTAMRGRLLFDRCLCIIHACSTGHARLLHFLLLSHDEAICCLPLLCFEGQLECLQTLQSDFHFSASSTRQCSPLVEATTTATATATATATGTA
eukprot:TRINITY_DN15379_c0_g1_i1.p1 TRINITY_DN15379_c0_g1~~TRINITY_DN15379_c0_g1_i1.p1  ORF type:complete len:177 (-),score=19.45 TRINITY_DN15379_c0_g1_i1:159-689(-)